jgi:hypothetical protein
MTKETIKITGEATPTQIAMWKKEFGASNVFRVDVKVDEQNTSVGYFRKPDLAVLGMVSRYAAEPMKAAEVLFDNLWLGGDEAIKNNDELKLSCALELKGTFQIREAEIKNV